MTYNLMNLGFLVPIAVIAIAMRKHISKRGMLWTALLVFTATAIFDNYIIASGIVAYQEAAISGVKLGLAPIEDFGYAIAAIVGLPAIWESLTARVKEAERD